MAFRVGTRMAGATKIYELFDDTAGSSASIVPSYGFNLFDLRLPLGDKVRPVVVSAPDWGEKPREAMGNGFPILFPFPNRIKGGKFTFGGKSYAIPPNLGPHAIHGFALDAPWDVLEHEATGDGATITGRYQLSKDSPKATDLWPTDAVLIIQYTLVGGTLTLDATVSNPTADPLPYGLGFHPYFRLPFDPSGDRRKTAVVMPASRTWTLEDFIPTGEVRPVDARLDFRKGQPIEGLKLDDVLTGLPGGDEQTARLVDENLGAELRFTLSRHFRELVLYTPPDHPGVISVEPYTQTTDAINLHARRVDGGLRILRHGEQHEMRLTIQARKGGR